MASAFCVCSTDNVATLLDDARPGGVEVIGSPDVAILRAASDVAAGHKLALRDIPAGAAVIKYGVPIGLATIDIRAGDWGHPHNCRSRLDERSSTLDTHTGVPTDTCYE